MSNAARRPGMFQRMLSRPVPAEPDPADLGTCIGLEFSLDEPPEEPATGTARPSAVSWVQRLTSRARPAR